MSKLVPVVVGVIKDQHKFLIAKRPPTVLMPGFWEFPGGKIEPSEAQFDTLIRELDEEIGIKVLAAEFLTQFTHMISDRCIELNVWHVTQYEKTPYGKEQQQLNWVTAEEFTHYQFLPSNEDLLEYLTLNLS